MKWDRYSASKVVHIKHLVEFLTDCSCSIEPFVSWLPGNPRMEVLAAGFHGEPAGSVKLDRTVSALSTTVTHLLPTDAEATLGRWLHWKLCSGLSSAGLHRPVLREKDWHPWVGLSPFAQPCSLVCFIGRILSWEFF